MSPKKDTQELEKSASTRTSGSGFTADELAAMKEHAEELKSAKRRGSHTKKDKAEEEGEVLAKIAEMAEPDRSMAERVHQIIKAAAPTLDPKTWYGMPAYARDGKVICFFQPAQKFGARYGTLGFNDGAHLDDGAMWPVAYALTEITPAEERKIGELVKRAAGA